MRRRRISERQIRQTLDHPDRVYPDPNNPGATRAERDLESGNMLRVAYTEIDPDTVLVITVIRISP
jgi:hypothetical protein